jgi:hypothetical protein
MFSSLRNVSAVPSGNNSLTFYLEEEEEEFTEDDLEELAATSYVRVFSSVVDP